MTDSTLEAAHQSGFVDRSPRFHGGSPADQQRILALYEELLVANDGIDNDHLRRLWSDDPQYVFINLNGYQYYGREDWLTVWDFYRPRFQQNKRYTTGNLSITINGDMAVVLADQGGRYNDWVGPEPGASPQHYRATVVYVRTADGDWTVVHAHFSVANAGLRPDQGGEHATAATPDAPPQADDASIAPRTDRAPVFDGGSPADQAALLALHHAFLAANDPIDNDMLRKVWSADPENLFFNTNGYTYYGLEDWLKVWDYYRPRFKVLQPYTPGDVRGIVRGDMAAIVADYVGRNKTWVGSESSHNPRYFRATQIAVREAGGWKVIHAHFSEGNLGPRPEQRG
jgi:ketosteroid isomerase-like protein